MGLQSLKVSAPTRLVYPSHSREGKAQNPPVCGPVPEQCWDLPLSLTKSFCRGLQGSRQPSSLFWDPNPCPPPADSLLAPTPLCSSKFPVFSHLSSFASAVSSPQDAFPQASKWQILPIFAQVPASWPNRPIKYCNPHLPHLEISIPLADFVFSTSLVII